MARMGIRCLGHTSQFENLVTVENVGWGLHDTKNPGMPTQGTRRRVLVKRAEKSPPAHCQVCKWCCAAGYPLRLIRSGKRTDVKLIEGT